MLYEKKTHDWYKDKQSTNKAHTEKKTKQKAKWAAVVKVRLGQEHMTHENKIVNNVGIHTEGDRQDLSKLHIPQK